MLVAWLIAIALSSLVTLASMMAIEQCLAMYLTQQQLLSEQRSADWLYRHFRYQFQHLAGPIHTDSGQNGLHLRLSCYDEDKHVHQLLYHHNGRVLRVTKDAQQSLILMNNISVLAVSFQPNAEYVKFNLEFNVPHQLGIGEVYNGHKWSWVIAVKQIK